MIQRYLKILSYGIKLSKLYLVLRIFQLILSSASSAFSLLLPKMLLNAIATKQSIQGDVRSEYIQIH